MSNPATAVVTAASDPIFYSRVSFIALKVAQMIAAEDPSYANHENRVAYSNRVFQGSDNAILLAQHVATNASIAAALAASGPDGPLDSDIEYVLTSIWDARANAFAPAVPPPQPPPGPAI
jgi:hypothetical protein